MRPLGPFWKAVTTLGGMGHSRAGWRVVLGAEADLGTPFLRSLGRLATGYPCDPRCLMNHMRRIVEHGEDHFHAVCRAEKCATVRLTRDEVAAFEIDLEALARAVLPALGMTARTPEPTASHRTWRVGAYVTTAGIEVPVILSTAVMPYEIKRCLGELIASRLAPFVVLVARPDTIDAEATALLRRERCASLVLQDVAGVDEAGRFSALRPVAAAVEMAVVGHSSGAMAAPVPAPSTVAERVAEIAPAPSRRNSFRREGSMWTIVFNGRTTHLRDGVGPSYLARLVQNPRTVFKAVELHAMVAGQDGPVATGSAGEVLDDEALSSYAETLREIDAELSEAREDGDADEAASLERQKVAILQEVKSARGMGGRKRRASDDAERLRNSVRMAIRRTIREIEDHDELKRHLEESIKTGYSVAYLPDPLMSWVA